MIRVAGHGDRPWAGSSEPNRRRSPATFQRYAERTCVSRAKRPEDRDGIADVKLFPN
jgi:hypothetical protein